MVALTSDSPTFKSATHVIACTHAGTREQSTFTLTKSPRATDNTGQKRADYYHRNQQYSITAVTTSAGAIAERYAYSAYGEPTICDSSGSTLSSSTINNRYSYTGREWDATVGLYHFRARWMSPKSGRFLGRDPIGYRDGISLFAFIHNSGLNAVDPMGWEREVVMVQQVPIEIEPYRPRPHGPTIIPRDKCILGFECVFAGPGGAKHCGLNIVFWDSNTRSSVNQHLHAFGWSAGEGETGGCAIDSVGGDRVDGMNLIGQVLVPKSACECILNNISAYNTFMSANDNYQAVPREGDICGSKPGCNSNFATGCQLSKCNINHRPGVWAPGIDHKMKKCTSSRRVPNTFPDPKTGKERCMGPPRCECEKWEYIDTGICGGRS